MRGAVANGEAIRELRKSLALTQEDLAVLALCDVKTVCAAEKGRRVDFGTLQRIAEALSVNLSSVSQQAEQALQQSRRQIRSIRAWQRAFDRGDVDGMLKLYRDDAVLRFPWSHKTTGGGAYRGKDALRRLIKTLFACLDPTTEAQQKLRLHAVDDCVFLRGQLRAKVRVTGHILASEVFHEFRMRQEKIVEQTALFDTARVQAAVQRKCRVLS